LNVQKLDSKVREGPGAIQRVSGRRGGKTKSLKDTVEKKQTEIDLNCERRKRAAAGVKDDP